MNRHSRGFTLIEILVALAVVAVALAAGSQATSALTRAAARQSELSARKKLVARVLRERALAKLGHVADARIIFALLVCAVQNADFYDRLGLFALFSGVCGLDRRSRQRRLGLGVRCPRLRKDQRGAERRCEQEASHAQPGSWL